MMNTGFPFSYNTNWDSTTRYKYHFNELQIDGIDFSKDLKISGISQLETKNKFNIKVIKKGFIKPKKNPKLLPIYISRSLSDPSQSRWGANQPQLLCNQMKVFFD